MVGKRKSVSRNKTPTKPVRRKLIDGASDCDSSQDAEEAGSRTARPRTKILTKTPDSFWKSFHCRQCAYRASTHTALKKHQELKHGNGSGESTQGPHYCKVCDFSARSRYEFEKHTDNARHRKAVLHGATPKKATKLQSSSQRQKVQEAICRSLALKKKELPKRSGSRSSYCNSRDNEDDDEDKDEDSRMAKKKKRTDKLKQTPEKSGRSKRTRSGSTDTTVTDASKASAATGSRGSKGSTPKKYERPDLHNRLSKFFANIPESASEGSNSPSWTNHASSSPSTHVTDNQEQESANTVPKPRVSIDRDDYENTAAHKIQVRLPIGTLHYLPPEVAVKKEPCAIHKVKTEPEDGDVIDASDGAKPVQIKREAPSETKDEIPAESAVVSKPQNKDLTSASPLPNASVIASGLQVDSLQSKRVMEDGNSCRETDTPTESLYVMMPTGVMVRKTDMTETPIDSPMASLQASEDFEPMRPEPGKRSSPRLHAQAHSQGVNQQVGERMLRSKTGSLPPPKFTWDTNSEEEAETNISAPSSPDSFHLTTKKPVLGRRRGRPRKCSGEGIGGPPRPPSLSSAWEPQVGQVGQVGQVTGGIAHVPGVSKASELFSKSQPHTSRAAVDVLDSNLQHKIRDALFNVRSTAALAKTTSSLVSATHTVQSPVSLPAVVSGSVSAQHANITRVLECKHTSIPQSQSPSPPVRGSPMGTMYTQRAPYSGPITPASQNLPGMASLRTANSSSHGQLASQQLPNEQELTRVTTNMTHTSQTLQTAEPSYSGGYNNQNLETQTISSQDTSYTQCTTIQTAPKGVTIGTQTGAEEPPTAPSPASQGSAPVVPKGAQYGQIGVQTVQGTSRVQTASVQDVHSQSVQNAEFEKRSTAQEVPRLSSIAPQNTPLVQQQNSNILSQTEPLQLKILKDGQWITFPTTQAILVKEVVKTNIPQSSPSAHQASPILGSTIIEPAFKPPVSTVTVNTVHQPQSWTNTGPKPPSQDRQESYQLQKGFPPAPTKPLPDIVLMNQQNLFQPISMISEQRHDASTTASMIQDSDGEEDVVMIEGIMETPSEMSSETPSEITEPVINLCDDEIPIMTKSPRKRWRTTSQPASMPVVNVPKPGPRPSQVTHRLQEPVPSPASCQGLPVDIVVIDADTTNPATSNPRRKSDSHLPRLRESVIYPPLARPPPTLVQQQPYPHPLSQPPRHPWPSHVSPQPQVQTSSRPRPSPQRPQAPPQAYPAQPPSQPPQASLQPQGQPQTHSRPSPQRPQGPPQAYPAQPPSQPPQPSPQPQGQPPSLPRPSPQRPQGPPQAYPAQPPVKAQHRPRQKAPSQIKPSLQTQPRTYTRLQTPPHLHTQSQSLNLQAQEHAQQQLNIQAPPQKQTHAPQQPQPHPNPEPTSQLQLLTQLTSQTLPQSQTQPQPVAVEMPMSLDQVDSQDLLYEMTTRGFVHMCDCGIGFTDETLYRMHERFHTLWNPSKCAICHGRFMNPASFIRHINKHCRY